MAKILIIDNDDDLRAVIVRAVMAASHYALEAADGRSGVALGRHWVPDLVVTDINLSHRDGVQTIVQLREFAPSMPIIVISDNGRGDDAPLYDPVRLGADVAIPKPFETPSLMAEIDRLLNPGG